MNAEQIKEEIRKLSRIDTIEIYRWIDEEAAADLLPGSECQEIEQRCRVITRGERLRFEKPFRFLPWSTQIRIGRLSPYAMMGHCGFIMAHGCELRIYRRILICRAV